MKSWLKGGLIGGLVGVILKIGLETIGGFWQLRYSQGRFPFVIEVIIFFIAGFIIGGMLKKIISKEERLSMKLWLKYGLILGLIFFVVNLMLVSFTPFLFLTHFMTPAVSVLLGNGATMYPTLIINSIQIMIIGFIIGALIGLIISKVRRKK